jgi:Tfp pilus assembly protein PilF
VRFNQKDYEGAIKECTTALEIDPNLSEAYATRSRAHKELKHVVQARADETEAERLRKKAP